MAMHRPGKVARAIGDFLTIVELATLIEHECEYARKRDLGWKRTNSLISFINVEDGWGHDRRRSEPQSR